MLIKMCDLVKIFTVFIIAMFSTINILSHSNAMIDMKWESQCWTLIITIMVTLLSFSVFVNCDSSRNNIENESDYSVVNYLPNSFRRFMFWKKSNENVENDNDNKDDKIKASIMNALRSNNPTNKVTSSTTKETSNCVSCLWSEKIMNEDEEFRQRIEYIKEQILSKLGMRRPPILNTAQVDIDYHLYMQITQQQNKNNDQFLSNIKKLNDAENIHLHDADDIEKAFILPMSKTLKSAVFDLSSVYSSSVKYGGVAPSRISILVHYNMTPTTSTEPSNVYSNYYYKTSNIEDETELYITAEPVDHENDISRNGYEVITSIAAVRKNISKNISNNFEKDKENSVHWHQYDVTELFSFDYANSRIRIHNKNFDILSSVIVLEMLTPEKTIRSKRSIDCTDNVSFCCRQPFYVNFTTIGWNNWILQPSGYNANYCKGKYPAIKLCCSPREMSSISLLYMDDKRRVYARSLSNMVVQSCDCA